MRDKTKQQSAPQIRGYLFMKLYKWLIVFGFYNVTAIRKLLKGCGLERVFLNGFVGVMKFRLYSFFYTYYKLRQYGAPNDRLRLSFLGKSGCYVFSKLT